MTKEEAKKQYIQNVQNFMPNIKLTDQEEAEVEDSDNDNDDELFYQNDEIKVHRMNS